MGESDVDLAWKRRHGGLVKPLDPRKTPYTRGDVVTRGIKLAGLVTEFTPTYLEVRWSKEGNEGNDQTERVPTDEIDNLLRVAHADAHFSAEGQTNLQTLNSLEGLDRIEVDLRNRQATIKSPAEQAEVDNLVKRAWGDKCAWDTKNQANLLLLIIDPDNVGMLFKVRERIHRAFCKYGKTS
jgi:hypothetical protein